MHFARLANTLLKDKESARDVFGRFCLQLCQIFTDLKKFTYRLNNKPFLILLLISPPHLKYAATLPWNLSLMACFADINILQRSVATYARFGEIFNMHLIANLPRNLSVKKLGKSVKI